MAGGRGGGGGGGTKRRRGIEIQSCCRRKRSPSDVKQTGRRRGKHGGNVTGISDGLERSGGACTSERARARPQGACRGGRNQRGVEDAGGGDACGEEPGQSRR